MLNWLCAGRIGLSQAHDEITIAYHMLMHFHAYVLYILYIFVYLNCFGIFLSISFSPPPHSLVYISAWWHQNVSLLRPGTFFVPGHLLFLLILLPHMFRSVMRRPKRTSLRTSLDEVFIWNSKSFCQTSSTLTYPLSFIVGDGSHYVTSRSHVHPCWSRSSTLTCMDSIIQYLFFVTHVWGTHIVVTSDIVSDVLCVLRVEYPDYPNCDCLKTVSKYELISAFHERPSDWGDRQFTPCMAFPKGPKFLNVVMTFILYLLSHYNSITEPHAWFLLSLLEHFTIDFLSHFILSIINVHKDTVTSDKLIFLSAITRILRQFSVPFPVSDHFHIMCAIDAVLLNGARCSFNRGGSIW